MRQSKKRVFLITVIFAILIFSSVALSGCLFKKIIDKFRPKPKAEVTINITADKTEMKANERTLFKATTNATDMSNFIWKIQADGINEEYADQGTNFEFSMIGNKKGEYKVWAELNSIKSNEVKITVIPLSIDELVGYLNIDKEVVKDGEKYLTFVGGNKKIGIALNLNEMAFDEVQNVKLEMLIKKEGVNVGTFNDSYEIVSANEIAKVSYNFGSGEYSIQTKIILWEGEPREKVIVVNNKIEKAVPVENLGQLNIEGVRKEKHYYVTTAGNTIRAEINVLPVDAKAKVANYYLKSEDGEFSGDAIRPRLVSKGHQKSSPIKLSRGKNVLQVKVDNFDPIEVEIYHDTKPHDKQYLDREFYWYGRYRSSYIQDIDEMNILIGYLFSRQDPSRLRWQIKLSDAVQNIGNISSLLKVKNYVVSAGSISCAIEGDGKERTLIMESHRDKDFATPKYESKPNPSNPTPPTNTSVKLKQVQINRHFRKDVLKMDVRQRTSLPADNFEETIDVYTSEELYQALQSFKKPIINNPKVENIYNKARNVLLDIIDDKMTDYDKVLAIYDYLVANIHYDYTALHMEEGDAGIPGHVPDTKDLYAYFLEGVFNKGTSVCDGKSKAFVLLCGMEGIHSRRVTGNAGGPHAWNKVLVAVPGDVPKWYNLDATQGEYNTNVGAFLTHEKFLFSYTAISGYTEDENEYTIKDDNNYDYYANTTYMINGKELKLKSTTRNEFKKQIAIIRGNSQIKAIDLAAESPTDGFTYTLYPFSGISIISK